MNINRLDKRVLFKIPLHHRLGTKLRFNYAKISKNFIKEYIFALGVFLYLLSVLFCPPINFGIVIARIDEIAICFFVIIAFVDFRTKTKVANIRYLYKVVVIPYMCIFMLFCWGILWGESIKALSPSYIKMILRPLFLIMVAFTFRWVFVTANKKISLELSALLITLCLAGILGLYAMYSTRLAMALVNIYNPELILDKYRFNMSVRAMSVFYGYDQASITYAIGGVVAMAMILNLRNKLWIKVIAISAFIVLLVSIVSSARTGFVSLIGSMIILFGLSTKKVRRLLLTYTLMLGFLFLFIHFIYFAVELFPKDKTIQRFSNFFNSFTTDQDSSLNGHTEWIRGIIDTQVEGIRYPRDLDMIFGFGDKTNPISDVGYISVFVKYGLVGLLVIYYVFYTWSMAGFKMLRYGFREGISRENLLSFFILPTLAALFLIAAMKGPLYFLSAKTGEIVAMLIGLSFFEFENIMQRREGINRIIRP